MIVPGAAGAVTVLAYALLIPAGCWQADDYVAAWGFAQVGWGHYVERISGWSPRPFSELLAWAYFALSHALHRPLISSFLLVLWAGAVGGIAWAARRQKPQQPIALGLVLLALVLLLSNPAEMFYWPMGAVAYLPAWAALAAATVAIRSPEPDAVVVAIALTIAATSAEVGATAVMIYAALRLPWRSDWRMLALPVLCVIVVTAISYHYRAGRMVEVRDVSSGLAGHWLASVGAAMPTALNELGIDGVPLWLGVAGKLSLVLLFPGSNLRGAPAVRAVLWALALILGALASIVLAYHQFGDLCCGRHASFRQGELVLAGLALATLVGRRYQWQRGIGLAALMLALLAHPARTIQADLQLVPSVVTARSRTWNSGLSAGDAMTDYVAPPLQFVRPDDLPGGTYQRAQERPGSEISAIMDLFRKHTLTVRPLPR